MSDAILKDAPPPRLCLVVKNTSTEEYGYNLHAERGKPQFIGTVDISSPADRAGLRPGDRIFAVNGHSIIGENHKRVVERIKENPLQCELLVISEEGADWYKEHNIPVTLSLPNIIHSSADTLRKQSDYSISQSKQTVDQKLSSASPTPDANWYAPKEQYYDKSASLQAKTPTATTDSNMTNKPRPRLCRLVKSSPSDEFGFNLHAEKSRGHFIGAVDKDGIGELAGLEMGQRIVGVNGHLIYPTTPHKEVVGLIKMNPLQTDLLVASEEVDRWYSENASEFSFDFIDRYQSNRSVRFIYCYHYYCCPSHYYSYSFMIVWYSLYVGLNNC
ncbi:unnamed protein product [Anisakis simplex]|uniref:PDZ domain-containing protein n=1 Tax=Anisakis simplex TaxID=6269 RepID=A0A0M3K1F1_ANISI|nr:unnamed protein product [Anisakis simplex]